MICRTTTACEVRSRSCFTVVELLAVLFMISLFTAVAVPIVASFTSGRSLEGAARATQGALLRARSMAISHNKLVRVTFERVPDSGNKASHFIIVIWGPQGREEPIELPSSVTVGMEAVTVKLEDATPEMPAHEYPIIFRSDGSLLPSLIKRGEKVFLTEEEGGDRVVILRDRASEQFTDENKSYFGNIDFFKNGVYDAYEPVDGFLRGNESQELKRRIDRNLNGIPDNQRYVLTERYTGRTYITDRPPDQWLD